MIGQVNSTWLSPVHSFLTRDYLEEGGDALLKNLNVAILTKEENKKRHLVIDLVLYRLVLPSTPCFLRLPTTMCACKQVIDYFMFLSSPV